MRLLATRLQLCLWSCLRFSMLKLSLVVCLAALKSDIRVKEADRLWLSFRDSACDSRDGTYLVSHSGSTASVANRVLRMPFITHGRMVPQEDRWFSELALLV